MSILTNMWLFHNFYRIFVTRKNCLVFICDLEQRKRAAIAALFVLLHTLTLLRQVKIQISTACANTANIHAAAVFIDRIQNHVIPRNILPNSRRTPWLHIIQRILSRKCSQILLYQSAKALSHRSAKAVSRYCCIIYISFSVISCSAVEV